MSVTYGFFDAVYDSGTGTYDRTYTAEQMSMYFKGLISDGVVANVGQMLAVTPGTGMTVQVGTGRMIIDSRWLNSDSAVSMTIEAAHATLPRKDIIFVRLDYSMRTISIEKKKGTPAASPVAPTLTRDTSSYYDMGLAVIDVPAGATSITAANITDLRPDETTCGFVTGLVDHIDTSGMWAQLQSDFETWFDTMKDQLTEDAAGNLQTQIDEVEATANTTARTLTTEQVRIASIFSRMKAVTGETTTITSGNFNDFTDPGYYGCSRLNGMQNAPYSGGYGILEVIRAGNNYFMQRFTYMALNDTYYVMIRTSADKGQTWKPWRRLYINS